MKKDFLKLSDLTRDEALKMLRKAADLKKKRKNGVSHQPLKGKSLGMIFSKQSTRTRISFEVAMFELGGHSLFLRVTSCSWVAEKRSLIRHGFSPAICMAF